jgi:hypothetical protein
MRPLRILAADNPPEFGQLPKLQAQTAQRFEPGTAVNNREPLFWSPLERARFKQVLNEARARCAFALYGLRFSGPTVSFFIKPADGLQLPEVMQWIKQTFAVRNNVMKHLDGHVWGDRYASWIVAGGPPKDAETYVFAPAVCAAGRGGRARKAAPRAAPVRGKRRETTARRRVCPAVPPHRTAKRP